MSDYQYASEEAGIVKSAEDDPAVSQQTPELDAGTVLNTPVGKGQSVVRAKAITQLQRSFGNQYVQRVVARSSEEQETGDLARAVDARRGHGSPLPDRTQGDMQTVLDEDLSGVRVHADSHADELSRGFGAKAFTTGQDIFFRSGAYDPGSASGDQLLAHELTHVVQQGNAPAKLTGSKLTVSEPGDSGETEASSVASSLGSGAAVSRREEVIQTQPEEDEEVVNPAAVQTQPEEDEEVVNPAAVQTQPEEEEMSEAAVQTQPEEDEEVVNPAAVQTQPEEDEEVVNPAAVQTQPEEEEEVVNPAAVQTQAQAEEAIEQPEKEIQAQTAGEEEEEEKVQTQVQRQEEIPEEEV